MNRFLYLSSSIRVSIYLNSNSSTVHKIYSYDGNGVFLDGHYNIYPNILRSSCGHLADSEEIYLIFYYSISINSNDVNS